MDLSNLLWLPCLVICPVGRVMCSPGVVMCPVGRVMCSPCWLRACPVGVVRARSGWYMPGRVVGLGRGGACPAGVVRAQLRGCFLPGKRDLQDLTDLSDLSDIQDIQDRLTPCQAIQHNTLSNQMRSSNLSKIIGQNEESNSLAFQILHIKAQSVQPEPPSAQPPCSQVSQSHPRVANRHRTDA